MQIGQGIQENLRFLVAEASSQLVNLQGILDTPSASASVAQDLPQRGRYAASLRIRIQEDCFAEIADRRGDEAIIALLRAVESIARDVERISDLCRSCVLQLTGMKKRRYAQAKVFSPLLENLIAGIEIIEPALLGKDTRTALELAGIKSRFDRRYRKILKKYLLVTGKKKRTGGSVRLLFFARSIEQMGGFLLDISEAIISANLGQQIDIGGYRSLVAVVDGAEEFQPPMDVTAKRVADTRSGCEVSSITPSGESDYVAIFKEGEQNKLREEREGVETWHDILPGLAPKVISYHREGERAGLLIEHKAGLTFEQIVLHESRAVSAKAMKELQKTLKSVWSGTKARVAVRAGYINQLTSRLDEVYKIHPEFRYDERRLCGEKIPSFDELLDQAGKYESGLQAPFSVYIHGDFNLDNIIYDPATGQVSFVDLHRSRFMDYVQDVSVFLVSNYRLPSLDAERRQHVMKLSIDLYRFAAAFADKCGDKTFEHRLALGLARSFATSTRFILDKSVASDLFLRARFLIEFVLKATPDESPDFRVPVKEIFVG